MRIHISVSKDPENSGRGGKKQKAEREKERRTALEKERENMFAANIFLSKKAVEADYPKQFKTLVILLVLLAALSAAGASLSLAFEYISENSTHYASADGTKEVEEELKENISETLNALDLKEFQRFVDGLSDKQKDGLISVGIKELMQQVINGELSGFEALWTAVKRLFFSEFLGVLAAVMTIIIICILKSILSGMTSGFKQQSTNEIIHFVCYAAVIIIVMLSVVDVIKNAVTAINGMKTFSEHLFPPLLTLMSALGASVSVGVYQPLLAAVTTIIIGLISSFILPIFIASTVFSAVGNISETVKLDKLTKLTKSIGEWVLMVVFGLFIAFVTMQGMVGASSDKVTISAARFALSSYVPILGGYLSDGFDLVYASGVVIKNALGYTGILVLLSIVLLPVLKTVSFILCMRLAGAIVEPLGEKRVSEFLMSVSRSARLIVTALVGTGFLFFIIIMLMLMTVGV